MCLTLLDAAKRGLDAVVPLLAAGFLDLVSLGGAGVQTITEWLFASGEQSPPYENPLLMNQRSVRSHVPSVRSWWMPCSDSSGPRPLIPSATRRG